QRVDVRADVYALGALLYWLLAGRAPFAGPPLQVLNAVLHCDPEWPRELDPSVPADLDALCRHAMAKDPAARPADAAALRDLLARWLAGEELALAAGRPRRVAALAAVAAAAALGVAALW